MITDTAGAISVSGTHTYATAGRDVATVSLSDDGAGGTTTAYSVANVGGGCRRAAHQPDLGPKRQLRSSGV